MNGEKVIKHIDQTLYEIVHAPIAKTYWTSKGNVSVEAFHQVHWDNIDHAMEESSCAQRMLITKHTTGMTGLGKFLKRWKI